MKKPWISKKVEIEEVDYFGPGLLDKKIVNPLRYKAFGRPGKGRPRRSDYQTVQEIWKDHNSLLNAYLDALKLQCFPTYVLNKKTI